MKLISKRFRFGGKLWEILMIDNQVHFLVKDILPFFEFSPKSQGTVKKYVSEHDRMIISGEIIRDLKHVQGRCMVVNKLGLVDFAQAQNNELKRKGMEFVRFVNDTVIPEMRKKWEKEIGNAVMIDDLPFTDLPDQDDPDLFDIARDEEVAEMKLQMDKMDKRIEYLEKKVKELQMEQMVETDGERKTIDADALIRFLQGTDVTGHVR